MDQRSAWSADKVSVAAVASRSRAAGSDRASARPTRVEQNEQARQQSRAGRRRREFPGGRLGATPMCRGPLQALGFPSRQAPCVCSDGSAPTRAGISRTVDLSASRFPARLPPQPSHARARVPLRSALECHARRDRAAPGPRSPVAHPRTLGRSAKLAPEMLAFRGNSLSRHHSRGTGTVRIH